MRYAVFTVSLPEYTPEEGVRLLHESGYDGVEWRVTDQPPSTGAPGFSVSNRCTWPLASLVEDAPRIRALSEQYGLAIPNVGTYVRCDNPAQAETVFKGVVALGAGQVRIDVTRFDTTGSYTQQFKRAQAQYREIAQMAKEYGVRSLIEIHHGSLTPSASAVARFLEPFDPQDVGAIHDAGNMVHEGYEHYRLGLEVLGPYLAHVHLKNAQWRSVGGRPDGSVEWKSDWATINGGVVDMAALFRALRQVGYDGWVSFEDFSTEQPVAERTRDNLRYIKAVAQAVAAEAA
ncbi:MAG: sugar phosphate isomerase/epimerase [Anaerolineae bacterium]|nr:sugar phosphate isomerase/epimerase [Anaerolineae bacterium]